MTESELFTAWQTARMAADATATSIASCISACLDAGVSAESTVESVTPLVAEWRAQTVVAKAALDAWDAAAAVERERATRARGTP